MNVIYRNTFFVNDRLKEILCPHLNSSLLVTVDVVLLIHVILFVSFKRSYQCELITLHYCLTLVKITRYSFPLEAFWWYFFPLTNIFFSCSFASITGWSFLTFKSIRAPEFFWKLEFFKSIASINFFKQSRKKSNVTLFCQKSYDSVIPSVH